MTYAYRREYRGPIQAALLDWAGTTMDFGCMARAYERMRMAGAHYVVDTIADMLPCFDDVAARLARGEKP